MKTIMTKIAALAVVGLLSTVSAIAVSFTLGTGEVAISGYAGPYGFVDVTLNNSTQATITFNNNVVAPNVFLFGAQGAVAVNVNATSWAISALNGTRTFGGAPSLSSGGSAQEDGWGTFNQTIDSFDGYGYSLTNVSFLLTNTGGTWASASNVLAANAGGNLVAAHIFVAANPADLAAGAKATGYATNGRTTVPDGGTTALLLGLGLVGLSVASRRFGKA